MKRILYVHHGKGIGGAPLSLLYLVRALDRDRFVPTVVCIHESEAADLFRREGIETVVLPRIRDFSHTNVLWYPWWQWPKTVARFARIPFDVRAVRRFLRSRPVDVVHLNTSTLLSFGIAARREGIPVVWHIREPLSRGYVGIRRAFVRRIVHRNASVTIPISRYDAAQLIEDASIHVVYNFVDFAVFDASIPAGRVRAELGIPGEAPVVLMLGGVNRIKGTEVFVRAAVRLLRDGTDAHFLVAGEIPGAGLRNRLSGRRGYGLRVASLVPPDLAKRIRFLGVRSDVPQLLAASTLLSFPSTVAHFARPIIEASAMGVPVVASDLGGPRELVVPGVTGLLVPPSDADALADAIAVLLADPDRRAAMSVEARTFARAQFDAEKNAQAITALYDTLPSGGA